MYSLRAPGAEAVDGRRRRRRGGFAPGLALAAALVLATGCAGGAPDVPPIPLPATAETGAVPPATAVPTPAAVLGFDPGSEAAAGRLPDWAGITRYFAALAEASPRVRLDTLGRTTLDRPYVLATVASPGAINQLDAYQAVQQRFADPRTVPSEVEAERLAAAGRTVVLLTAAARSDAIGSVVAPLRIAHRLASGDGPLERAVLASTIVLIVPSTNPDGVDRIETWRERTRGESWADAAPPFPEHPFAGSDLGTDVPGLTQIETRLMAERVVRAWHPHAVHVVGGAPREGPAAGHASSTRPEPAIRDAAPGSMHAWPSVFTPLAGPGAHAPALIGATAESRALALLESAARHRERWLRHGLEAARSVLGAAPDGPDGWVIEREERPSGSPAAADPLDDRAVGAVRGASDTARTGPAESTARVEPDGTAELLRMLAAGGVEVHEVDSSYYVGGRRIADGSYVVPARQPQARFARLALAAADVLGVDVAPFTAPETGVDRTPPFSTRVADAPVRRRAPGLTGTGGAGPRIAVYASHAPSPDEGWTRWALESYRIPYATVRDADIRRRGLARRFDAIVLPDDSAAAIYAGRAPGTVPDDVAGGIGAEGTASLADFVRAGGTLVTLGRASRYAIEHLGIPLSDRVLSDYPQSVGSLRPGVTGGVSTVSIELDGGHPITAGLPAAVPAVADHALVLEPAHRAARIVGRYADDGASALVEVRMGRGRVVLFGFRPHYRGLAAATLPLFFNALKSSTGPVSRSPGQRPRSSRASAR